VASVAIKNTLIELMRDRLQDVLIDNISEPDEAAGLVKIGSLQDDPTANVQNILIREAGIEHRDEMHDAERNEIYSPAWEIGGGGAVHYWRKFKVEFDLYFLTGGENRDEARTLAFITQARAERAIWDIPQSVFPNTQDDFGETAHLVVIRESGINEGGGPEDSFIWRGEMMVEFMTEKYIG
jgi:hypothetical protein